MSSSFLRAVPVSLLLVSPSFAAEFYQRPVALLRAETSSNVRLSQDSDDHKQTQSYTVDLSDVIGIATPTSDTTLKPRIRYQKYPDNGEFDRLEADLSFNSTYNTQRSSFFTFGRFSREDAINAELPNATFNEVIPGEPTNPDTGQFTTGLVRNDFVVVPNYSYHLSPRMTAGASVTAEVTRYNPSDDTSHIDFNYYQGRGQLTWAATPKADVSGGVLYTKYDAKDTQAQSTARGLLSTVKYSWSPLFYTTLYATYQRTNNESNNGLRQKTNNFGATVTAGYKTQISEIKLIGGRTISPSGAGGLYYVDQLQAQYTRNLSERFSVLGAVRLQRNGALAVENGNDRKYARADVSLDYDLSPKWFVSGGYGFIFQKYSFQNSGAHNNQLFVVFGYNGLRRQH